MRIASVVALVIVTASPNVARAQAQDPSQALRARVQLFQTAWNAHDAGAVAAFFADDADQVMGDGPTTVGRQALEQWWRARFASMEPGRRITLTVSSLRLIAP